ncbi:alpha/beta fold hydrolase [Streptomyces sp. NPDC007088]|uniref:alpha/beta fold hydrolase n=1 Tax=Streptomyces sp. NPDC007088 TaxID=3364773 RepID=UPI0036D158CF
MPTFPAFDGTPLSYRVHGTEGDPVICVPGGPTDSAYLGDLGGLSARRRLCVLDLRGTGASGVPEDTGSYRCDRMAEDVEALRAHLGLDRMDLLAHSAGANLAARYAARHPQRVNALALITPGTRAVGIGIDGATRRETARLRADEPWFPAAYTALEAVTGGTGANADWEAIAPFQYGRWDDATRAFHAATSEPDNPEAVAAFGSEGAFDPEETRAGLAASGVRALLLAGEYDLNSPPPAVAAFAKLFGEAVFLVQPQAGHYPWLDDAGLFVRATAAFLG